MNQHPVDLFTKAVGQSQLIHYLLGKLSVILRARVRKVNAITQLFEPFFYAPLMLLFFSFNFHSFGHLVLHLCTPSRHIKENCDGTTKIGNYKHAQL